MTNALDFAGWFVQNNKNIKCAGLPDQVVLLKQLFFAQMIHLAMNKEPLFNETLYALDQGPVVDVVRQAYKADPSQFFSMKLPQFTKPQLKTLGMTHEIYGDAYGDEGATELSELSHYFPCWKNNHKPSPAKRAERRQDIEELKMPINDLVADTAIIQRVIDGYNQARDLR